MSLYTIYVRDGRYFHHKEAFSKAGSYLKIIPGFKRLCHMDIPRDRFWPENDAGFTSLRELFESDNRLSKLVRIDMGIDEAFESINAKNKKMRGEKRKEYRKLKFKVVDYHAVDKPYDKYPSCSVCNSILYFYGSSWNVLRKGDQEFIRQECCNNIYVKSRYLDKNGKWIFMKNPILEGSNGERIKHP